MTATLSLITLVGYLLLLFIIAGRSSRNANNATFFKGGRQQSPLVVAIALMGAPISGISLISLPGSVVGGAFSYLQFMFGVIVGYTIIAYLLIPLFYRLNVTSLYEYLASRFGISSHRSGAWIFIVSKVLSASLRAFVICIVVQQLLCNTLGVPFFVTAMIFMLLVWLYTRKGGGRIGRLDRRSKNAMYGGLYRACHTLCTALAQSVDWRGYGASFATRFHAGILLR